MGKKKTDAEIEFIKQFKNPITKFLAWMFRYRRFEISLLVISILIAAMVIMKKEDLKGMPFIKNLFYEKGGK